MRIHISLFAELVTVPKEQRTSGVFSELTPLWFVGVSMPCKRLLKHGNGSSSPMIRQLQSMLYRSTGVTSLAFFDVHTLGN